MELFIVVAWPHDPYDEGEIYAVCDTKERAEEFKKTLEIEDLDARYTVLKNENHYYIYLRRGLFFQVEETKDEGLCVHFVNRSKGPGHYTGYWVPISMNVLYHEPV